MDKIVEKANQLAVKAYVKADLAKDRVKNEITELANNELGVSGLVVSLILIGIAAVLALVFREQIVEFMGNVFKKTNEVLED